MISSSVVVPFFNLAPIHAFVPNKICVCHLCGLKESVNKRDCKISLCGNYNLISRHIYKYICMKMAWSGLNDLFKLPCTK